MIAPLDERYDYVVLDHNSTVIGVLRAGMLMRSRIETLLEEHYTEKIISIEPEDFNYKAIVDKEKNEYYIFYLSRTWIY